MGLCLSMQWCPYDIYILCTNSFILCQQWGLFQEVDGSVRKPKDCVRETQEWKSHKEPQSATQLCHLRIGDNKHEIFQFDQVFDIKYLIFDQVFHIKYVAISLSPMRRVDRWGAPPQTWNQSTPSWTWTMSTSSCWTQPTRRTETYQTSSVSLAYLVGNCTSWKL